MMRPTSSVSFCEGQFNLTSRVICKPTYISNNKHVKESLNMKKLNQFQQFNFSAWQKGKKFMISGVKYNEKKDCVSLDVIITEDETDYGDDSVTNVYEKFKVHLINETDMEDVDKYAVKSIIVFKRVGKCTVWGDYNTQLSVEAEVEVIE